MPFRRLVLPLLAAATVAAAAGVAAADSASDASLVALTNDSRHAHGLRSYAVADDLTAQARRWAAWMASHRTLAHNPGLGSSVCCWRDLGDNVGRGKSAAGIHRAFMASTSHRDNILSRSYTQVGIGTARASDGTLYVDEIFRRPSGTAGVAAPAPPTATRTTSASTARSPHRASRTAERGALQQPAARAGSAVAPWRSELRHWLRDARRQGGTAGADPVTRADRYARVMRSLLRH